MAADRGRTIWCGREIAYYLDNPVDTRLRITAESGRLWQKLGVMHASARVESSVDVTRESFAALRTILANVGLAAKVAWYRERTVYEYQGLEIALDSTVGYGYMIEAEILCVVDGVAASLETVNGFFCSIAIEPTPRTGLENYYAGYLANWSDLTADLDEAWADLPLRRGNQGQVSHERGSIAADVPRQCTREPVPLPEPRSWLSLCLRRPARIRLLPYP